jgi:hypothetical protein
VDNAGTRIIDRETDIDQIECPFVAHFGGEFVLVYKIENDTVFYLWNGKAISVSMTDFLEAWDGIILLAEAGSASIEPNYKEHRKKELLNSGQQTLVLLAVGVLLATIYISHSLFRNWGLNILLLLNGIGVYIGYLLVLKQLHVQSHYADKICSLFSRHDCNNVLESKAAKLWGVFGWSEIGLGYFMANVLLLLVLPATASLLALVNLCTLPYSLWSVWYQKVIAKQWCALCLIVQVLLWLIFGINWLFGYLQMPDFSTMHWTDIFFIGSVYIITMLCANILVPILSKGRAVSYLRQEISSLKANEAVFKAFLVQQPFINPQSDSQILFGNPDACLRITILTNPFCNPCARMHKRVEKLLKDTNYDLCVQYSLASFEPGLNFANKYLIAAYLQKDRETALQLFSDWFEKGKPLKEDFFKDLQLDIHTPAVESEFQKHEAWREQSQLRATPTILVNGYQLPENYKIEDLRYFTEFNVDIK